VSCMYFIFCFYFFFSSRRRHTRCLSDWSSDVCSSDLFKIEQCAKEKGLHFCKPLILRPPKIWVPDTLVNDACRPGIARTGVCRRSEERRVGKECRSRWSR